jgi:hypothetical protein
MSRKRNDTQLITAFFMEQPLSVAATALDTAKAIVASRQKTAGTPAQATSVGEATKTRKRRNAAAADVAPVGTPAAVESAPISETIGPM